MKRISLAQVETSERFFMMPKALFELDTYRKMKLESKMAYGILKDRFKLSISNDWIDSEGNVFLYYTNEALGEILGVGKDKVIRIKKELREFGLLEEERQGLNKPNRIYISNLSVSRLTEKYDLDSADKEVANYDFRKSQIESSRSRELRVQEVANYDTNDTELNNTKLSDTESFKEKDDDELINNTRERVYTSSSSKNQTDQLSNEEAFGKIAEVLKDHQDLRPIFQSQFEDLLFNETAQALIVLQSLVKQKGYLENTLRSGNNVLQDGIKIEGQDYLVKLIQQESKQQLAYMAEHLVNSECFGHYFDHGLTNRIKVAINTVYKTHLL
ncbi:replication initiator protein A [Leuconostoc pseudomesenteroides]|uniref:replication initiator protein A n=1 Tax=Leuconostoc pseudomesenteroides TaxID=33968 RepID=UPI0032DF5DC7